MLDFLTFYPSKVRVFRHSWRLREECGRRALFIALGRAENEAIMGRSLRQRYWMAVANEVAHQFRREETVAKWVGMEDPEDVVSLLQRGPR